MSLIRQIWLLLLGSLVVSFLASIALSVDSARDTFQTQLRIKNSDNAIALAQVLSQQEGDFGRIELLMTAQFDTGFYRELRLTSPDGKIIFLRESQQVPLHAPGWFAASVPIEADPGFAQISSGWRQIGTLRVISHSAYAHDDLWKGALEAVATLALVMGLAAAMAAALVRRIQRPIERAVEQARSLLNGEFVTIDVPDVPELARLIRAMNSMVNRLRVLFESQSRQVEMLRLQVQCDPLTGVSNRKHFLGQLSATLQREDGPSEGGLILLRVLNLADVNLKIGYEAADRLITTISQALKSYTEQSHKRKGDQGGICHLGRLNGSDFGLYLPAGGLALETATAIVEGLSAVLPAFGPFVAVAIGAIEISHDRNVAHIMAAADNALARAESKGPFSVEMDAEPADGEALHGQDAWRQGIVSALVTGRAKLVHFPLVDANGQVVHLECPLRLRLGLDGRYEVAGRWLPFALRARLTAMVDERAVSLALADIAKDKVPRCVHICGATLREPHFANRIRAIIQQNPGAANSLGLEIPEAAAVDDFDSIVDLVRELRPFGIRFGLEHAGERLQKIERLFEARLQFIKLDAAVVQGVATDAAQKEFVRSVVVMLHGLSLEVYAEGVSDDQDARTLLSLGINGIAGPWALAQQPTWTHGPG